MSKLLSIIIYLGILVITSGIISSLASEFWATDEPAILYLLSVIVSHLIISSIGDMYK